MSDAPLEPLFEAPGLPTFDLPDSLVSLYGGSLGLDEPCLIANFVSTLDGVVAIPDVPASNRLIAGGSRADRFLMGLLRACCDAVVIGAGTLSASPSSLWTPARAYPDAADGFAELRRRLGRPADPELVVLSASGRLDPTHPAILAGALVVTSDAGAARLGAHRPREVELLSLGPATALDPHAVLAALAARGHTRILSEGGPHALAPYVAASLVDELFLTLSPILVGRDGEERLALVEGADLLAGGPAPWRLRSARRAANHLFLRYALEREPGRPRPSLDADIARHS